MLQAGLGCLNMTLPLLLFAFVAGLLIGSFLNVCIYRAPRDLSVISPRSFCPECDHPISWRHNIPVLSYVWLHGRCAYCSRHISARYPIVEFSTGLIFALITLRFGVEWSALKWIVFAALLIFLFFTDLEERLLPNEGTVGGSLAGLIISAFVAVPSVFGELLLPAAAPQLQSVFDAVLGGIILAVPVWVLGAVWSRFRQREALGFGDVKLLALIGIFLGAENGIFALTLGAVAGALGGIATALWTRKAIRTYELPFGSYLCAAAIVVVLLRVSASPSL